MPIYLFSMLAALKSIIKKIRNISRKFLWGGKEGNRKWPLVDWQTIFTPKAVGGLGLRDSLDNNKVMRTKIWWRWVNYEDEPWAKMWHLNYAPQWQEEIWNSIESQLKETISLQQWTQEEYYAEANERIILYDLGVGELPPNNLIA